MHVDLGAGLQCTALTTGNKSRWVSEHLHSLWAFYSGCTVTSRVWTMVQVHPQKNAGSITRISVVDEAITESYNAYLVQCCSKDTTDLLLTVGGLNAMMK